MIDKLKETNNYKVLKSSIGYLSAIFIFLLIIFTFIALASYEEMKEGAFVLYLFPSILLIPIIRNGINLLRIRRNAKNFEIREGIIIDLYTPFITRHRTRYGHIKFDGKTIPTKIYFGELYDEVANDTRVEFFYSENYHEGLIKRIIKSK